LGGGRIIDLHIIDISGFSLQEVELELELGPSGPDFKQIALIPYVVAVKYKITYNLTYISFLYT